jgi:hypothetical protein
MPLQILMDEETPDGPRTTAILANVREEDLLRFCDFCYTSTYTDPYPVAVKHATPGPDNGNAMTTSTAVTTTTEDSSLQPPPAKRLRTESPAASLTPFGSRSGVFGVASTAGSEVGVSSVTASNKIMLHGVFGSSRVFGASNGKPKITVSANDDHTNVLIAHAAMYSFAVRFEIAKLKVLSLGKLHDKLTRFELKAERVADVLTLVRYVYETERSMSRDMQELRALVVKYVVSEVSGFGTSDEFGKLLEEGGLFVRDFWNLIHKSLL